jgi:hypothetical protein
VNPVAVGSGLREYLQEVECGLHYAGEEQKCAEECWYTDRELSNITSDHIDQHLGYSLKL